MNAQPLTRAIKDAFSVFLPTVRMIVIISTVALPVLAWSYGEEHFARIEFEQLPGIVLWSGVCGLVMGVLLAAFRVLVRFAGPVGWLPLIVVPTCVVFSWWLFDANSFGEPVLEAAKGVGNTIHADMDKMGRLPGGHGGGEIVAIIILPILVPYLLFRSVPLALAVLWMMAKYAFVCVGGFGLGLAISLPPLMIAFTWRIAKLVKQGKVEATAKAS